MATKRLCLIISLLVILICQQGGIGADAPAAPTDGNTPEAKPDEQLEINRAALLKGPSEQIRIKAATVMLLDGNPQARKILLDALRQSENGAARIAVCKALSQAGAKQGPIKDKEDFIDLLLEILTTAEAAEAKFAAGATLIFEYKQISKQLEKMATAPALPAKARLNAIYALKLQPAKEAILKLMDLLEVSEKQIADAAKDALISLNIPVGEDAETRKQNKDELNRMGREEFLGVWKIRQQQQRQISKLETELDWWKERYLAALDEMYYTINGDDAKAKGEFLAKRLGSPKAIMRLWALERVEEWRKGTNPKLPAALGPILVNLISDQNRDVRLKTARLLSLMGELNSAEELLKQFKVEENDEVKMEMFVALGGACYYAFLPDSLNKISPEIRRQTLEWAAEYLFETDMKKAQKSAEVIKKLLEQDGLTPDDVDKYLDLLAKRYEQEKGKAEGPMRGRLLNAMAGLCAQSVYKTQAAKLFNPLFEQALSNKANLVREAAVDGLIYVDKARALKMLRGLVRDSSVIVRKKIVELASEVGGKEDLAWLAEKIGTTTESESAWQAMREIFKRSDAAVLAEWIGKFDSPNTKHKISADQKFSVLEIAEGKADGENKLKMLKDIREKLADLCSKTGDFERAAEYLGLLLAVAQTPEEKETILAKLLDAYLKWPKVEAVGPLIANRLSEGDLDPNSVIVRSIDSYLAKPPAGADPKVMLEALTDIKIPDGRPMWAEQMKRWADRLGRQAEEPDKPKRVDKQQ